MSLLEYDHQKGAGVQERYKMYKIDKIYKMYEIAEALSVTSNGLHARWLDLWQSQLPQPIQTRPFQALLWEHYSSDCI